MKISRQKWMLFAPTLILGLGFLVFCFLVYNRISQVEPMATAQVGIGDRQFVVEIAWTPRQRQRGLQNREHLSANAGMLFIQPSTELAAFWMKDTLIPLDMIFLDKTGRVVSIHLAAQPCRADPCPVYSSGKPVDYVLELAAGQGKDITVGDEIVLPEQIRR